MSEVQEHEEEESRVISFQRRYGRQLTPDEERTAKRTSFVARFIVLREGRRSRAHRTIEQLAWDNETTAEELYERFRQAFIDNGDKLQPVDRDLNRALEHASRSVGYFVDQYVERGTLSFQEALHDYEKSNKLLFGEDGDDVPRKGGWRLPNENKRR